jgi:predicted acetylornithine/succinylornithine family transaminase
MEKNYIKLEQRTILQTYSRFPIVVTKAVGNTITDINGTDYKDYLSGIAVNILGHSYPPIIDAIKKQSEQYLHISNYFYQPVQIDFANELLTIARESTMNNFPLLNNTGYDKVFFANSGAEANEGAIKLCRYYGNQLSPNKTDIIAFTGGFHGRTIGTLSLMNKPKYKYRMHPFLSNIKILEYNNCEELIKNVNNKISAIFLEFIQGENGVIPASDEFIDTINELRTQYHFLIVADEVQTGMGRTGKFFAYNHYNINPDIITIAKGLGGGLPIAAMLTNNINIWHQGQHGTTFGGNPLACAAGMVVLSELKNGIIDNAKNVGAYFIDELNKIKSTISCNPLYKTKIIDVRGIGLIIGIELAEDASIIINKLLNEHHIIANFTSGNIIRLLPPLNITKSDVDFFVNAFIDCCLDK